jgi:hypothetical protein
MARTKRERKRERQAGRRRRESSISKMMRMKREERDTQRGKEIEGRKDKCYKKVRRRIEGWGRRYNVSYNVIEMKERKKHRREYL